MKKNGKHETSPAGRRAAKRAEKIAAAFAGVQPVRDWPAVKAAKELAEQSLAYHREQTAAYLGAACTDENCGLCRTPNPLRNARQYHTGLIVDSALQQYMRERTKEQMRPLYEAYGADMEIYDAIAQGHTSTARVQALRERRAGLKRVEVYAHPDDAEAIKRYATRLARKRERLTPAAPTRAP